MTWVLQVISTAVTRESSKANAEAVKVQEDKQVSTADGDWLEKLQKIKGDVETIMKLQPKLRSSLTAS